MNINNFPKKQNKMIASREALDVLKQTVNQIKNLNSFNADPDLLCMTAQDIANSLGPKINLKDFLNHSNNLDSSDFS